MLTKYNKTTMKCTVNKKDILVYKNLQQINLSPVQEFYYKIFNKHTKFSTSNPNINKWKSKSIEFSILNAIFVYTLVRKNLN